MVLSEGVFIAVMGGALGIAAAKLALIPISEAIAAALPAGLTLPPSTIWSAVGFMLLVGLGAGLIPALQAMRLTIIQALARR